MFDQLIYILNEFQTLIVGTLGFAGVILTIWMNARLARKQIELSSSHEQEAFRTAIYCELESIFEMLNSRANDLSCGGRSGVILSESVPLKVYESLRSKIGLLDNEEIKPIIKAYLLVEELPIRLKVMSAQSGGQPAYEGYISISAENIGFAAEMHSNFAKTVQEALAAIKV